jgi:ubiquinone/menaquinone biosynthesis C-methylase UbiE
MAADLHLNAERFSGRAYIALYDKYRPIPPEALLNQSLSYLGASRAGLLVDLGCGTGLSTFVWHEKARMIVGVEPSRDMLEFAKNKQLGFDHLQFIQCFAHELPLEDGVADIVCCAQSFHWMDPELTLKEVGRVLKPGGVLVVYDCKWPPAFRLPLEEAFKALFKKVADLAKQQEEPLSIKWSKSKHKKHIKASGIFNYIKEYNYHKVEFGGKEQFLGIALSQGGLQALLKKGYTEEEVGLTAFKEALAQEPPMEMDPLTFHYKAIFAVK